MINNVVLVGRLTKEVELRKTNSGLSVATFTVACDRRGQKNPDGTSQADFISVTAWRQSAEFLGQYAHKGAMVAVEGRIQTRSFDDQKTGQKRWVTEVVADNVSLLESKSQSMARAQQAGVQQPAQQGGYQQPQQPAQQGYQQGYQQGGYQQPYQPYNPNNGFGAAPEMEEDPFGSLPSIDNPDLPF